MALVNILNYVALALEIGTTVQLITVTIMEPGPVSGSDLLADVQPALSTLQAINPKIAIPEQLAVDLTNSVADTLNLWRKTPAAPAAPLATVPIA